MLITSPIGIVKGLIATAKINPIKATEEALILGAGAAAATTLLRVEAKQVLSSLGIKLRT
ncbi:MAG: hypothetical protein KGH94_04405 [Candidatus Micrarchaeota archaeon]|nr:hypothetical protein [Candidatus Micrarchaeota archaeon]